ncbi:MAG TPA: glycosyltransferase family 2 protein [Methylococcaceae bacterium]|nr:glycosyltransferase family 2 protein [Methylococcaceae bacterium]
MSNSLTVVIPTRNRPDDLGKAVASILAQSRLPDEFLVVDQSAGEESRTAVEALLSGVPRIRLDYIHDPRISGLVEAKQVAAGHATGEIVYFLEDDVVLETDYLEQIERGFAARPEMLGCCGIVTNPPRQPPGYAPLFHLFHRGIFRDPRVGLFGRFEGRGHSLIPCPVISGGLSAWRREVFAAVPFDVANGFFMLEDMDFSTRVARRFGPRLFLNPNARLAHYCSPVNRDSLVPRQRRKLVEFIVFYKKRRDWPGSALVLPWLLVGLLLEAAFQSLTVRSFGPLRGYFLGVSDGFAKRIRG